MNSLLDTDAHSEQPEVKGYGDVPPPATPSLRASADVRPVSPAPDRRTEPAIETKLPPPQQSLNLRRSSVDVRSVSPVPDRKGDLTADVQVFLVTLSVFCK